MDELDPLHKVELAMLRAEYQKRYQTMVAYLKDQIGAGDEYRNSVARVVVSSRGAYYELNDLPEEFMGAAGDHVTYRFVAAEEAESLLTRAIDSTARVTQENTRHVSLFVLYSRRGVVDRMNCYVYDYSVDQKMLRPTPQILGVVQPDTPALFFKIKIDADFAPELLGLPRGAVFCLANIGDRSLLVSIPFTGDQVIDLNSTPTTGTIH